MNSVFQALLCGGLLIAALVALVVWWRRRYLLQGRTAPVGASVTEPNTSSQTTVQRRRLRDLGLQFGNFSTGKFNAITDVAGVKVGHVTLRSGDGALVPGTGPVRTGVTAILPHSGDIWNERVSASAFVLNGNGCVTGLDWVKESGALEGPVLLTNTLSIGRVYDAAISWMLNKYPQIGIEEDTYLPVVGECDDSSLNDIRGRHVQESHVFAALDGAKSGRVDEGAVGAGTGMICYDFKGGIGTASRVLATEDGAFTVGVLVNCNHGDRHQLLVDGVSVGKVLNEDLATEHREGSICIVVATDAPLNSRQLERVAKRAALGLARTGAVAQNDSGDFVLAFSTGRTMARNLDSIVNSLPELDDQFINPLFEATVEATEEAILNALFMAETTVGRDGNEAVALPIADCLEVLRKHGKNV
jgi:D-aminopeptidase